MNLERCHLFVIHLLLDMLFILANVDDPLGNLSGRLSCYESPEILKMKELTLDSER